MAGSPLADVVQVRMEVRIALPTHRLRVRRRTRKAMPAASRISVCCKMARLRLREKLRRGSRALRIRLVRMRHSWSTEASVRAWWRSPATTSGWAVLVDLRAVRGIRSVEVQAEMPLPKLFRGMACSRVPRLAGDSAEVEEEEEDVAAEVVDAAAEALAEAGAVDVGAVAGNPTVTPNSATASREEEAASSRETLITRSGIQF